MKGNKMQYYLIRETKYGTYISLPCDVNEKLLVKIKWRYYTPDFNTRYRA